MEIQRLKSEIIAKIRSPSTLNNVTQCVVELVLNSLDAKSTAIAVRVNLITLRLQIVDNGEGITKENFEAVGLRYMTNKCYSLEQLEKQVKQYGFRGETLANVIDMSKTVEITSKYKESSETYCKTFGLHTGTVIKLIKNRPSCGTTVTIEGFLCNLPIRKNRIVPELELEDIKKNIEYLVIIHPKVSFSVRNEVTGDLLLNSKKNDDVISAFRYLYPQVRSEFSLMKVSKQKITVEALLFKEPFESKSLQYIYVNKRPVFSSKIQKFVANLFYKMQKRDNKLGKLIINKNKHPIYVLNIQCPFSSVDILLNPSKTMVEFNNWNTILRCLEKLLYSFFGSKEKVTNDRYLIEAEKVKSDCGVSQMCGAFRAYGYKRHNSEKEEFVPAKVQKVDDGSVGDIIEETQFSRNEKNYENVDYSRSKCKKSFREGTINRNTALNNERKLLVHENDDFILNVPKINKNSLKGCLKSSTYKKEVNAAPSEDVYSISDFTPSSKKKIPKFKQPLPVKMSCKNKINEVPNLNVQKSQRDSNMNISLQIQPCVDETFIVPNKNPCEEKVRTDDEKSLYSKFTDDENKGKNLIMDMFLKSTQIYNSEEEIQSNPRSEETLFEVESNVFMENNFQTKVDGFSKTMSVSVNIKSTKKIRNKVKKKSSKCLQTSLECKKMASKCVQTSIDVNDAKNYHKISSRRAINKASDFKLADNYTVVFSDKGNLKNMPHFKFMLEREAPFFSLIPNFGNFTPNCNCGCHDNNKKVFNFQKFKVTNENFVSNNILNDIVDLSESSSPERDDVSIEYDTMNNREYYKQVDFEKNFVCPVTNQQKCLDRKFSNKALPYLKPFPGFILTKEAKVQERCNRSPYFLPQTLKNVKSRRVEWQFLPNELHQRSFYNFFDPQYKSTQVDPDYNKQRQANNINVDLETVADFTIDNFGQFQPVHKSTQYSTTNWAQNFNSQIQPYKKCNNVEENGGNQREYRNTEFQINGPLKNLNIHSENQTFDKFKSQTDLMNVSECLPMNEYNNSFTNGLMNRIPCNFSSPPKENVMERVNRAIEPYNEHSELVITLSNQEKQAILERELLMERNLNEKKFENWDSQGVGKNKSQNLENGWDKRFNKCGSRFYINKKTGYTTFFTPKLNCNEFRFDRRFEFMPKGLSPIMRKIEEVDKSLSQNKKDLLQNYILESHQDELLVVKWQNYIKNNNPKEFFDEVYREKVEHCGKPIPCINTNGNKKLAELNSVISFDKNLFNNITVIGQVDKKFIAVLEKNKNLLILFDQHAVHERIRLEHLLKGIINDKRKITYHGDSPLDFLAYEGSKVECEEKYILFVPQNDLSLLKKHELYLNSLGLSLQFFENGVTVSEIPLCLYKKFKDNKSGCTLNKAIEVFVKEIIELLKATRGVSLKNLPPIIQDIINLEACRGAIKFGDNLTTKVCGELLEKLSICKLPFQCAHGRPTLTPLLTLMTKENNSKQLNFRVLRVAT